MKTRKLFATITALTLGASLCCGCSAGQDSWTKTAQTQVADTFDASNAGQIYIKGQVYDFPMTVQDLLDTGWHYSSNYSNLEGSTLDANMETDCFEMFSDEEDSEDYITIAVYNPSVDTISIDDALVTHLDSGWQSCEEVMIPGGLYIRQSKEDAETILNTFDGLEEDTESEYSYTSSIPVSFHDDYTGTITFEVYSTGDSMLSSITFELDDSAYGSITNPIDYVDAHLEYFIHQDDSLLTQQGYLATDFPEKTFYTSYIADALCYYVGLDYASLTEDQQFALNNSIIPKLLAYSDWEISAQDDQLLIDITYPNTLDIVEQAYVDVAAEDGSLTAEDFISDLESIENDPHFSDTLSTQTTSVSYTIDVDTAISSDDWDNLALILGGFEEALN